MTQRMLLTTRAAPLPTWGWGDSLTDASSQRFTKGQDIFTASGHMHCHSLHMLAQNVSMPTNVLEFPDWDDFLTEVKKGYEYVGISYFSPHSAAVEEMCKIVKKHSPKTQVMLGSLGTMGFSQMFKDDDATKYVDHVCHGEGVEWTRKLLGEPTDRPITQRLMPKCGMSVPWIDAHPKGTTAMLVSGLGCPSGCDFCSTTTHFGQKRNQMASPQQLYEEMKRYRRVFPQTMGFLLLEEDHFIFREHLQELGRLLQGDEEWGIDKMGYLTFGSIRSISQWDPEEIALTGIGSVFIGVESKFAPAGGYNKRTGDAKEVFDMLHGIGVGTTGAWMCGWDWHDHQTIYEDLNWFVSLEPTTNQLSRVCPFPGTPLWDRLREEGRVDDETPWEDVHFYGGGYRHTNFTGQELMDIMKKGYERLYETHGASPQRSFKVAMNGYEFCRDSKNPILNQRLIKRHERASRGQVVMMKALREFAPNAEVQSKIDDQMARYKDLFGDMTPPQKVGADFLTSLAAKEKKWRDEHPEGRPAKVEPFKVYEYDGKEKKGDEMAYKHYTPHVGEDYKKYLKEQAERRKFFRQFLPKGTTRSSFAGEEGEVKQDAALPTDFILSL